MMTSINDEISADDIRLIMYHKSSSSGRTQFFRLQSGAVCVPDAVPPLSEVIDDDTFQARVTVHPAPLIKSIAQWLDILENDIEINSEYHEYVDVPDGPLTVYLARFTTIDPPFANAEAVDAKFVALTEMLDAVPAELELLRRAYAVIM